jgi:hypothetical protein
VCPSSCFVPVTTALARRHGGAGRICCVCDKWKMVYPMLGLWIEAGSSDFLPDTVVVGGVRVRLRDRGYVALV